jgi:hypothetical protein
LLVKKLKNSIQIETVRVEQHVTRNDKHLAVMTESDRA